MGGAAPRLGRLSQRASVGIAAACLATTGIVITSTAVSGAGTKIPYVDNTLCVKVRGAGFHNPIDSVILQNAIQPIFFAPLVLSRTVQCNPVAVAAGTTSHPSVSWVRSPQDHLLCWGLTYSWKAMTVQITNRFGTAVLSTGSPSGLCLPTWSSTVTPPKNPSPQPPGIDHFTCYPLSTIAGSPTFKRGKIVRIEPIAPGHFVNVKLKSTSSLCVPTTMIDNVNSVEDSPQTSNDRSLTCFAVTPTTLAKRYYDLNEFGAGTSRPTATSSMCVPSTIQVKGPTA